MLAVSELLYDLVEALRSGLDNDQAARSASARLGKQVSPANVDYLIEHKLKPLGIMANGAPVARHNHRPILSLAARRRVVPQRLVRPAARALGFLFRPAWMITALAALVVMEGWFWLTPAHAIGIGEVAGKPGILLAICLLTLAAGGFHELGHAAASEYGGAEPGPIGFGIYLLWPAFFSDLTSTYCLNRRGRLRADLGGIYFSGLCTLILGAAYAVSDAHWVLIVVLLQHALVIQQCLPFLRLDGYYVVSDLVGVPDLFGHIRPLLSGLIPGRTLPPSTAGLRRGARIVVRIWVLATVPALAVGLILLGLRMPQVLLASLRVAGSDAAAVLHLASEGRLVPAGVGTAGLLVLAVPFIGLSLTLGRMVRAAAAGPRRGRSGSPKHAWGRP